MPAKKPQTQPITIRVSEEIIAALSVLQQSGLYGSTINETAERLLSDAIAKRFPRKLLQLGIKP